mmetsp:Transcript_31560/g.100642  ORF Transcript_31560/g.100642 Transcript_31560/m.100642 type:complete len:265 (+) Transcript_31560:260-1054(+)
MMAAVRFPERHARCSAVRPLRSVALALQPQSSRRRSRPSAPVLAAWASSMYDSEARMGRPVFPSTASGARHVNSLQSTSRRPSTAPPLTRHSHTRSYSLCTASRSGVRPESSARLGSPPARSSTSTSAACPMEAASCRNPRPWLSSSSGERPAASSLLAPATSPRKMYGFISATAVGARPPQAQVVRAAAESPHAPETARAVMLCALPGASGLRSTNPRCAPSSTSSGMSLSWCPRTATTSGVRPCGSMASSMAPRRMSHRAAA